MSNEAPTNSIVNFAAVTAKESPFSGKVSLVGAGPGDPDLLTLKALRVIQQADLILFDRLVSKEICQLFPSSTPALYVGKAKDRHSVPQDEINELLVTKAQQGLNICRLKGGDAFVFGRGGEEMLRLMQEGIEVELVPGITAAAGCTSYAGIPLTHRGLSQGCTFVTAHAEKELDIRWDSLALLDHTLVFYMGLSKASLIAEELIKSGLDSNTPAALIENGCCPKQRVVRGKLNELAELVTEHDVKSPALIVIGKVVDLADQLQWFVSLDNQKAERLMA
ncbi:uroporphyrinogen-III C-methyltransferase [Photobacterium profundum]|uniref:uroporphyrinogen-III C-methyltransferase n=1 Tax=Photobacterium profundum 3TCK TaxID=314280 RepID=Q1Z447_9GAMM|nr:uroporphyrinogen-III C-methyltransferase [Photobacterium profundum]EAS43255.1 putative uroporphyrin-III C-methyltransferase [Photobacterium profundum 3TCK]PSV61394.1 uroporphyrinogen-III C-methyltransferase [Photobacterium profundum]